jgi:hypothetical protein
MQSKLQVYVKSRDFKHIIAPASPALNTILTPYKKPIIAAESEIQDLRRAKNELKN